MKTLIKHASPLALAIGLALGTASTLAQQQGADEPRSGQGVVEPRPGQAPQQPGSNQPRQAQPGQAQPGQARPAQPAQPQQGQSAQRGSQSAEDRDAGDEDGLDALAEKNSDLSQFVEAIKAAGLEDTLTGGTEYTVFAPTNDALDDADFDALMRPENRAQLLSLLRAHIVADDLDQELASRIRQAQTIDGGNVEISAEGDRIMIAGNEAKEAEDIDLGNLRVYAVDEVLSRGRSSQAAVRQDDQRPGAQNQGAGAGQQQGAGQQRSQSPNQSPGQSAGQRSGAQTQSPATRSGAQSQGAQPGAQNQGAQRPGAQSDAERALAEEEAAEERAAADANRSPAQ